jgi:hypothetical protein
MAQAKRAREHENREPNPASDRINARVRAARSSAMGYDGLSPGKFNTSGKRGGLGLHF